MMLTFWPGQLGAQQCQPPDGRHDRGAGMLGNGEQRPMNIISHLPSVELQCESKLYMCVWGPEARSTYMI